MTQSGGKFNSSYIIIIIINIFIIIIIYVVQLITYLYDCSSRTLAFSDEVVTEPYLRTSRDPHINFIPACTEDKLVNLLYNCVKHAEY